MSVDQEQVAPVLMAVWIAATYGLLIILGQYSIELSFTISLIGLLVVGFLFAPPQTSPKWWSHFRLLTILALLVFGYIVFQRVMAVVQG